MFYLKKEILNKHIPFIHQNFFHHHLILLSLIGTSLKPCDTNGNNVSFLSFDICYLAKIKHYNMNEMIILKETFILPSSKLFAGSPKLREYLLYVNNINMNYKEANG